MFPDLQFPDSQFHDHQWPSVVSIVTALFDGRAYAHTTYTSGALSWNSYSAGGFSLTMMENGSLVNEIFSAEASGSTTIASGVLAEVAL